MTLSILKRAFSRASGTPRLVALHWFWHFALASIAALTVALALGAELGPLPVADTLLERPSVALGLEVLTEHKDLVAAAEKLVVALLAFSLLLAPLLAGGTLEVLLGDDRRPFGHRFGRGAGRFYGRFLRLGVVAIPIAVLAAVIVGGPLLALARRLGRNDAEIARWTLFVAALALAGLVVVFVRMALDLACAAVVREDRRDAVRTFFRTLGLTLRHPLRVLGLWLGVRVPWLLLLGVYLAIVGAIPVSGALGIVVVFLSQQLVSFGRAGLRVTLWAGQIGLLESIPAPRAAPQRVAPPADAAGAGSG